MGSTTDGPVRGYLPRDRAALYDVCLRTGASGEDATGLYAVPSLLGDVYVGPYLAFEPELVRVLDDGSGDDGSGDDGSGVGGYVLGALDTRAFEARCEREWWPRLRALHPLGSVPPGSADARMVELIHDPPLAPDSVVRDHPSHLHIDLLPRWQGGGWGRRLMEGLFERLAAAGSLGVHLGVGADNVRAIGFYRRLGFTELEAAPGAFFLGRRLG